MPVEIHSTGANPISYLIDLNRFLIRPVVLEHHFKHSILISSVLS